MNLHDEEFKPIDSTAKDGRVVIVRKGGNYARVKWTGDMWAYDVPDIVEQCDFEPDSYRELNKPASGFARMTVES